MTAVTRRRVLVALGATGAALAVGVWPHLHLGGSGDEVAGTVPLRDALRHIGQRHLLAHPEVDQAELSAKLAPPTGDDDDWERRLEHEGERVTDDFKGGETTSVDGWVLADTEVAVATLSTIAP